jgi:hypothetical protein
MSAPDMRSAMCRTTRCSPSSSANSSRSAVISVPGEITADCAWVCITTRSLTGRRSLS